MKTNHLSEIKITRRLAVIILLAFALFHPAYAQRELGARGTDSGGPLLPEQAAYDVKVDDSGSRYIRLRFDR